MSQPDLSPIAPWDDDHWHDPRIYWWSRLDGRYLVEARVLPARRVHLIVFDHARDDIAIMCRVMRLGGLPRYGPDPDDVSAWQRIVVEWIDSRAEQSAGHQIGDSELTSEASGSAAAEPNC